jgi:hypothetical protein
VMYAQCAMLRILTCYLYVIGWATKWFTVHEVLGSRIMIDAKLSLFGSDDYFQYAYALLCSNLRDVPLLDCDLGIHD